MPLTSPVMMNYIHIYCPYYCPFWAIVPAMQNKNIFFILPKQFLTYKTTTTPRILSIPAVLQKGE